MRQRSWLVPYALLCGIVVVGQACANGTNAGATVAGAGAAVAGGGGAEMGGSSGVGGSAGEPSAALGGTDGAAGAPEPVFDATALTVDGASGLALCRLSDDALSLLVTVKNTGATETGPTVVSVATAQTTYETRLKTPTLGPGASAELMIERGPLVGFVEDWRFAVTVDPDAAHGAAHTPVLGQCRDLRMRAAGGMQPLAAWYDAGTGLWDQNDWWTSANQLETVIDYSRETGDPGYVDEIDNTFVKNQSSSFDRFGYYDDDGWWAIAWIKAYDLSHQQKYLDMAKTIFLRMQGGWDAKCGGGIYWASAKAGANGLKNKNAIPNSLFLQVAAKLHQRTPGDGGPGSYLDWAEREWSWFKQSGMLGADQQVVDGLSNLTDCKPTGPVFTYNQGVLLGGLVDLAAAKSDTSLLDQADAIAHATMMSMADPNGILKEAPCGGDVCTQFKGVFMRNLAELYRARPSPELSRYMRRQSDQLWQQNKNAQQQFGYPWHLAFDKASASRQSSALDALIAAVAASNLNLGLGAVASGSAPCTADSTARNAFDGASRWGSKWCSGGAGGQSLTADLGAEHMIVGFRLRHAAAGGENPAWNTRDFEIETSADGATWIPAVSVSDNTFGVTTHPVPAVNARYARLHVTKAQTDTQFLAARVYEFEIFGTGR